MLLFVSGLLFLLFVGIPIVFWARKSTKVVEHVPVLVEATLPFFLLVMDALPTAFASLFQRVLGHSVYADFTVTQGSGGTKVTETWLLGHWLAPLHLLALVAAVVGMAWASWNLLKKQSQISNTVALCLGFIWIVIGLTSHVLLAPFD